MAQPAEEEGKFMNVVDAAVMPVDVRKTTQVGGSLGYVGLEVLVSYIARRVFKIAPRPVTELAAIHALSLPFIGGLAAFSDKDHPLGLEAPMGDQFMDGAKGIPAVFASTYIVNTYLAGLHAPKLDVKDILITAASKIATRPIMSMVYPRLGDGFRNGQDSLNTLFDLQREKSRIGDDKPDAPEGGGN